MKRLLYILGIFMVFSSITSCNKDNKSGGSIDPVTDVQLTPYYGSVILKWNNPVDQNCYYTLVSYVNADGKQVNKKLSALDLNESGQAEMIFGGFTDENTYTFSLTSYNYAGAASAPVTVTGAPLSTDAAKDYVLTTVKAVPAVQGAEISWTNETGVENYVVVSFTDGEGNAQQKKFNATASGVGIVGSFINATTLTVKVEDAFGNATSTSRTFDMTPETGEIARNGMSIAAISSVWASPYPGGNMLDGNLSTYWHSVLTGYPHWFTVDMGRNYFVNKLKLIPRQDDDNGPNQVQFLYSMDGQNFTSLGEYAFDSTIKAGTTFDFTPFYARYVKVICLSGPQGWTHMAEIYFYMN